MREEELLLSFFWDHGGKLLRCWLKIPVDLSLVSNTVGSISFCFFQAQKIEITGILFPLLHYQHLYHSHVGTYWPYMPQTALVQLSMKFLLMTLAFLINFFTPQNNLLTHCCLSSFPSHPSFICTPHSLPLRQTLTQAILDSQLWGRANIFYRHHHTLINSSLPTRADLQSWTVLKFALLFALLSTSRNILSMQNYCMCFSLFFSPCFIKSQTLSCHTQSCSTLSLTFVLEFSHCVSLSFPDSVSTLHMISDSHFLCCFIHTLHCPTEMCHKEMLFLHAANPKRGALLCSSHRRQ